MHEHGPGEAQARTDSMTHQQIKQIIAPAPLQKCIAKSLCAGAVAESLVRVRQRVATRMSMKTRSYVQ